MTIVSAGVLLGVFYYITKKDPSQPKEKREKAVKRAELIMTIWSVVGLGLVIYALVDFLSFKSDYDSLKVTFSLVLWLTECLFCRKDWVRLQSMELKHKELDVLLSCPRNRFSNGTTHSSTLKMGTFVKQVGGLAESFTKHN